LTTRDDAAEYLKKRMITLISNLYGSIINKEELLVSEGQFSWYFHVDILVMEELSLHQLDYICLAIRAAFLNLQLPQVIVTTNENTGKIEVGLLEEIYEDQENTD
jgi:exosome complex RNA-binding protein Rrp42 (RNase PH superfamily)